MLPKGRMCGVLQQEVATVGLMNDLYSLHHLLDPSKLALAHGVEGSLVVVQMLHVRPQGTRKLVHRQKGLVFEKEFAQGGEVSSKPQALTFHCLGLSSTDRFWLGTHHDHHDIGARLRNRVEEERDHQDVVQKSSDPVEHSKLLPVTFLLVLVVLVGNEVVRIELFALGALQVIVVVRHGPVRFHPLLAADQSMSSW